MGCKCTIINLKYKCLFLNSLIIFSFGVKSDAKWGMFLFDSIGKLVFKFYKINLNLKYRMFFFVTKIQILTIIAK